jgi:hypothetical protein
VTVIPKEYLTSVEGDFHQDKKVAQKVKAVTKDIKQNVHSDTPKIYTPFNTGKVLIFPHITNILTHTSVCCDGHP